MLKVLADVREALLDTVADHMSGSRVTAFAAACFDQSLPSTLSFLDDGSAFVVTGDIPAMWLRDSACQVRPLLPFAAQVPGVVDLVSAVVARQMRQIVLDPYANAFNASPDNAGHRSDQPPVSPWVWERKYEVDSLVHPFHLGYLLYRTTGHTAWFGQDALAASRAVVDVIECEQDHETRSSYRFTRPDSPVASDTLVRDGRGPQTVPTGLTWSGFRPSDDATRCGYNIPGNAFAAQVLAEMAELLELCCGDPVLAGRARRIRADILAGLDQYGRFHHPEQGDAWWYEVDGRGGALFMDDANVPSLLSLPWLGCCAADDPVYLTTRALVLSAANPYYFRGSCGSGVGSPHTPDGHIWPIALCVQGLTSTSRCEQEMLLEQLLSSDAGTGVMHESFSCHDPAVFTRGWFAWADAMFCELVLAMCGRPVVSPGFQAGGHG